MTTIQSVEFKKYGTDPKYAIEIELLSNEGATLHTDSASSWFAVFKKKPFNRTITWADINTTNDTFKINNHGLATGDRLTYLYDGNELQSSSTDYTNTSTISVFYVIFVDNDTIQLAANITNANNGTAINFIDSGYANDTEFNFNNWFTKCYKCQNYQ